MKLLDRFRLGRRRRPADTGKFQVAAMAMQLDPCISSVGASRPWDQASSEFCDLLINTVAGHNAFAVVEQLMVYRDIPVEEGGRRLMAATMWLDEACNGKADLLRAPFFSEAVIETWRHSKSVVSRYAVPFPPRADWPGVCAAIAVSLEGFRRVPSRT